MGQFELVEEVSVAGILDRDTGAVMNAQVILNKVFKADVNINSDKVKEWYKANMAIWKCPKYIQFSRPQTVNMTGEVLRRKLQGMDVEKIKNGKEITG